MHKLEYFGIIALTLLLVFWGFLYSVYADDYLYFADELVTQGEQSGYVLGTGENQVIVYSTNPRLEILFANFEGSGKDLIRFKTSNQNHLKMADTMSEFVGTGYLDALARVAFGISNFTLNQISKIFRAIWWTGDSWISGPVKAWVDAGKPRPMEFTRGVLISGKQGDMN